MEHKEQLWHLSHLSILTVHCQFICNFIANNMRHCKQIKGLSKDNYITVEITHWCEPSKGLQCLGYNKQIITQGTSVGFDHNMSFQMLAFPENVLTHLKQLLGFPRYEMTNIFACYFQTVYVVFS